MNAPQKRPDFGRFVDAGCVQSRQEPAKNSRQVDAGARGETGDGVGQKFGHFLEHVRIVIGAENGGNRVAKRGSEEFRGNRRIYMKLPWRENLGGKAREGKGKGGKETALAGAFQRAPKAGPKTTLLPRRRELPRELGWWGGDEFYRGIRRVGVAWRDSPGEPGGRVGDEAGPPWCREWGAGGDWFGP